jgi:hypothetical protein
LACILRLVSDFCAVCPPTDLYIIVYLVSDMEINSKAIPLQAWTGPEGFRRLRFPDFKTVGTFKW